jgi:hypothetical protein
MIDRIIDIQKFYKFNSTLTGQRFDKFKKGV